jgi:hypothetical protein
MLVENLICLHPFIVPGLCCPVNSKTDETAAFLKKNRRNAQTRKRMIEWAARVENPSLCGACHG